MWIIKEREDRGFVDAASALLEELRLVRIWLWGGERCMIWVSRGGCVDDVLERDVLLRLEL